MHLRIFLRNNEFCAEVRPQKSQIQSFSLPTSEIQILNNKKNMITFLLKGYFVKK